MIQHCVFLNLKQDVNLREAENIVLEISGLTDQILGFEKLEFGQNLDFENKSSQYSLGFIATFADQKALTRYTEHPLHIAIGSKLEKICAGGPDGIIVFDLCTSNFCQCKMILLFAVCVKISSCIRLSVKR